MSLVDALLLDPKLLRTPQDSSFQGGRFGV